MPLPTPDLQRIRPRLVLVHGDLWYAVRACRPLRQLGWDVWTAGTALEARRLARRLRPTAVVLGTELPDESGWLTCSKLVRQHPELRVYLVEGTPSAESHQFAEFVGAAGLFDECEGIDLPAEEALASA